MAWQQTAGRTAGKAGFLGLSFFWKIYFYIMIIVFLVLLSKAVSLSWTGRDITPGATYLGDKFLLPILEIKQSSDEILIEGFWISKGESFIGNLYYTALNYSTLIFAILLMILYFRIIAWIIVRFILWNTSMPSVGWVISIILVSLFQVIMLLYKGQDWNIIWQAYYHLGRVGMKLVSPIASKVDEFTGTINNTMENVSNISIT